MTIEEREEYEPHIAAGSVVWAGVDYEAILRILGARSAGAAEIVDPRPLLAGELLETFATYPELGPLLPAMGYGEGQIFDLEVTLRQAADAGVQAVAIGTPIDLGRLVDIPLPHTRCRYELRIVGEPTLQDVLAPLMERVTPER